MTHLKLYCFGPPRLEQKSQAIEVGLRKAFALFIYLAVTRRPHSREALATLLWPEDDQTTGRGNLRRRLYRLNQVLGQGVLLATPETIQLNPAANLWLDIETFQQHVSDCLTQNSRTLDGRDGCLNPLATAADLYTDDFLAGFTLPNCPPFDEWQFFQAESLRQLLSQALERLGDIHESQARPEQAIPYLRRWLALDPLAEPVHRRLMRLYVGVGQPAAALRQYHECEQHLSEELGVSPAVETTALYEAIKARQIDLPQAAGAQVHKEAGEKSHPPDQHHLPTQPTPFVGREDELSKIVALCAHPDCRLLTLVGPGGIGKTRLAIEAARQASFAHGVWFVSLAPLSSADSLVSTIADSVGLILSGSDSPKQQLFNYLRHREMLLLLDNFEHLLPGAEAAPNTAGSASLPTARQNFDSEGTALVVELLEQSRKLNIFITSRERLNISAEWVFPVAGLEIPADDGLQDVERYSAVKLFLQRARQIQPHLGWSAPERAAVVRICRLVGAMPLAIELAAAWAASLSCIEIAHEIGRSLDFLATSMRDLPARHRNIQAVFDHSWQMLTSQERQLFQRLSRFRGGFTRAAAQAVAGDVDWDDDALQLDEQGELQLTRPQLEILKALSGLVDKSFLRYDASGRYEIHELLRQYGAAKLRAEPQEEQRTCHRHAAYYLKLLAHQEPRLKGRGQRVARDKIAQEYENIKLGWQHAAQQGQANLLVQAANAFWLFCVEHSLFQELEHIVVQTAGLLAQIADTDVEQAATYNFSHGVFLAIWGGCLNRLGHYPEGLAKFDRAIAILQPFQAQGWIALTLNFKGVSNQILGNYEEAHRCFTQSIDLSREVGDRWLQGYSLNDLGLVTHLRGDTAQARRLSQQSLDLFTGIGDRRGMAFAFDYLGLFAFHQGDYAEADWLYQQSLKLRRINRDQWGVATALIHLGEVAQARGESHTARRHLLEAIQTADMRALPVVLDALVELALLMESSEEAAQTAEILQVSLQHPSLSKPAREKAEKHLARLRGLAAPQPTVRLPDKEADRALDVLVATLLSEQ